MKWIIDIIQMLVLLVVGWYGMGYLFEDYPTVFLTLYSLFFITIVFSRSFGGDKALYGVALLWIFVLFWAWAPVLSSFLLSLTWIDVLMPPSAEYRSTIFAVTGPVLISILGWLFQKNAQLQKIGPHTIIWYSISVHIFYISSAIFEGEMNRIVAAWGFGSLVITLIIGMSTTTGIKQRAFRFSVYASLALSIFFLITHLIWPVALPEADIKRLSLNQPVGGLKDSIKDFAAGLKSEPIVKNKIEEPTVKSYAKLRRDSERKFDIALSSFEQKYPGLREKYSGFGGMKGALADNIFGPRGYTNHTGRFNDLISGSKSEYINGFVTSFPDSKPLNTIINAQSFKILE